MGKGAYALLTIVLGFTAGLAGAYAIEALHPMRGGDGGKPAKETAYQRIMRTGELRCAYANFAPYFIKIPPPARSPAFGTITPRRSPRTLASRSCGRKKSAWATSALLWMPIVWMRSAGAYGRPAKEFAP